MLSKAKQKEDAYANEEARLRKWEQDLKDFALEVNAKSSEADKIIRREQLTKQLADNKK